VPSLKLTDDLGRTVIFGQPPQRIVSLVPSDTYTLTALGAADRIVGRTTYCEHALGAPTVGGTKNVDALAVIALAPQLVIANQEESARLLLEALAAAHAGVRLAAAPRGGQRRARRADRAHPRRSRLREGHRAPRLSAEVW
jgi:ABC-type hemin transport system substrate-binding protein